MVKTLVTHINPDLDAITAIWLLMRFGGAEFKKAQIRFVPAGKRWEEEDNNTLHVDTGLGKFDHHQQERGKIDTSASKLVLEWLVEKKRINNRPELSRLVEQVNKIDHFGEYFFPEPLDDRYELLLHHVLNGVKLGSYVKDDRELVKLGMLCLDGTLTSFKIRISAEKDVESGIVFETGWGKAIAVESENSGLIKLALKEGYKLVIRRDANNSLIRIKAAPIGKIDLTAAYERIKNEDPEASWYFHPSGRMILNGSLKDPDVVPSKLRLERVIEIMKEMYPSDIRLDV